MIVPNLNDLATAFPDRTRIEVCVPGSSAYDQEVELSAGLLRSYPIVWSWYLILEQSAYRLMEPFIDWDYFNQVEVPLPADPSSRA